MMSFVVFAGETLRQDMSVNNDTTVKVGEYEGNVDETEEYEDQEDSRRLTSKTIKYQLIAGSYNYFEAKAVCKSFKGKLAQIKNL